MLQAHLTPTNPCHTAPTPPPLSGCHPPEGRLMRFPSLSFSRLFLNLPLRFFTRGFSWHSWWMMMLSSRSRMSISRSASSCSLRRSSSSWFFCWSAARVSSSSQVRSSYQGEPAERRVVSGNEAPESSPVVPRRQRMLSSWLVREHMQALVKGKRSTAILNTLSSPVNTAREANARASLETG